MSGDRQPQIIPTALHMEMQRSYLEYAMSVIVGRALPDVRDGLKPVHRRILYAMHELGLLPDRPFRKCARVVGDVLGKYHPHGDQSVYDALVRLVQDFSCRYPLLAGHGNFGSVDDDPPAAMRYTECRLGAIAQAGLLAELNQAIVDFTPNFDGSQTEPVVLPARLPVLLLNGAGGIAVGMATNIPPHNLGELIDGAIALVDCPQLSDGELLEIIPAPDFPTGGIIVDDGGCGEAYTTGRGAIILRGRAAIDPEYRLKGKRSRQAIIITELPFQVNKAAWIEKVAELVEQGKLEDILDVRDESDRSGMRVVVELKKEANPELLLEKMYRQTALQINFGAILLALKPTAQGSHPKQMSLRELLQEFLSFREETLTRKYSYELNQAQQKLHLIEGFVIAIAQIESVINLIRNSVDSKSAREQLKQALTISSDQADAILGLPLRRLTTMERDNLNQEQTSLTEEIKKLERLLHDRKELLKVLKKDLKELKKTYGDTRRTEIIKLTALKKPILLEIKKELPPAEVLIQLSYKGYIRAVDAESRFSKAYNQSEDTLVLETMTMTDQEMLIFSKSGKVIPLSIDQIPVIKNNKQKGVPLITLLADSTEQAVSYSFWQKIANSTQSLIILSSDAKIKRSPVGEFQHMSNRGLLATKLKEQERLFWADIVNIDQQIAIATSTGRVLRMRSDEEQIPLLSRSAVGNIAMRLGTIEHLVGVAIFDLVKYPDTELVLLTKQGFGRRIRADGLRLSPRGSIGSQAIKFQHKADLLGAIAVVNDPLSAKVNLNLIITNEQNNFLKTLQIALSDIPNEPHNPQGRYILAGSNELNRSEQVSAVIVSPNPNN